MRRRFVSLLLFCVALAGVLRAQTGVRGTVFDGSGQPLPVATVHVAGTSRGTTSNAQGEYELRLAPGTYEVVYQYVSYATRTERVTVGDGWTDRDVRLATEVVRLPEFVVQPGAEDPAYAVMRQAIARRKFFRREVAAYTGKTYVKGVGRLEKYPKVPFIRKQLREAGLDTGVVFLTESVAEVEYEQPDNYREKVIALKVTGRDELTAVNRTTRLNFYEPRVFRAVSPLADNAMAHYRFELLGTFLDQGFEVNKVQVTPRRRNARAFRGTIYVVENRWNLHSVDLQLPDATVTHRFRQVFAPVSDGIWMPLNHQISTRGYAMALDLIRVDFTFRYTAVQSDYTLRPNPERFRYLPKAADLAAVVTPEEAEALDLPTDTVAAAPDQRRLTPKEALKKARELQKLQREWEREERQAEKGEERPPVDLTLELDSAATKRDTSYWQAFRPVPLTTPELTGYRRRDSVQAVRDDPTYRDSVEAVNNRFGNLDFLTGYEFRRRGRPWRYRFSGLIDGATFNTVEGYVLAPSMVAIREQKERTLTLGATGRWGFASERFYGFGEVSYAYRPARPASFGVSGGRYVQQFNPNGPITPLANYFTTLFLERNYVRLYEREFAEGFWKTEVRNGLYLDLQGTWEDRRPLRNQATLRFVDLPNRTYEPNVAAPNAEVGVGDVPRHQALTTTVGVSWTPAQRYYLRRGRKRVVGSDYPTFGLRYRRGLPVGDGDTDFDVLTLDVRQEFRAGRRGQVRYAARGGAFLSAEAVFFPDFAHFMGNRTPFRSRHEIDNFHLLPYYEFSTRDRFAQAHAEFKFDRLLLPYVPVIGLLNWREVAFVNHLYTPAAGHYTEVGLGIDEMFQLFRVDFTAGFRGRAYQQFGVRIGMTPGVRLGS
ncbi:MAG: DUF5686 and carboxypeptidase regulatory-like domain-containing protein [Catalinimonas sp.]